MGYVIKKKAMLPKHKTWYIPQREPGHYNVTFIVDTAFMVIYPISYNIVQHKHMTSTS